VEFLSETGAEGAIIYRAPNLKQQIRAAPGPAYSLTFVHPPVHQEIRRPRASGATEAGKL
jgi:hypothetical protein